MLSFFSKIPIIGIYFQLGSDDYIEAFKEFFTTMIFALAPLWVTSVKLSYFNEVNFFNALGELASNGQLLCYSAAFLGPVIYLLIKDRELLKRYPNKFYFLGFAAFVTFIAPLVFPSVMGEEIALPPKLIYHSQIIFYMTLLVYFTVHAIENALIKNPAFIMNETTENFVDEVQKRRSK